MPPKSPAATVNELRSDTRPIYPYAGPLVVVFVPASELTRFTSAIFCGVGVSRSESQRVAESLVASDLCGHDSHGVLRVAAYIDRLRDGGLVAGAELEVLRETESLLAADAHLGFGQVQAGRLVERLLVKAKHQGVACGTMKNCGHAGRLGEWVERVAHAGLAGMMSVNDNGVLKCVAPPGGLEPRISTNPIAIGVPTGGAPLVVDISTSIVANGKVKADYLAGRQCPPGWLQDADGNPTTDPAVRFTDPRGTIYPLGGPGDYKGFGLGLLLDILIGGLSGGLCPPAPESTPGTNNVLLLIWAPEQFSGRPHFLAEADKLLDFVRSTRRRRDVDQIRLPSDHSSETCRRRSGQGIPLDPSTWHALVELARELDVDVPDVE